MVERLVSKGAIPKKVPEDTLHIAVATSNSMEYLLTWNFKHIANAIIRGKIEAVCRDEGYEPPIICPGELALLNWAFGPEVVSFDANAACQYY